MVDGWGEVEIISSAKGEERLEVEMPEDIEGGDVTGCHYLWCW